MNYKIIAYSAWERTREFFVETEEEMEELVKELKDAQYKVEVEEIEG